MTITETTTSNRCRCYYNLHKHCLSIQTRTPKGWRVSYYTNSINLKDVSFKVNETGRQRVIREKRKNVHALIEGSYMAILPIEPTRQVIYNPYLYTNFVAKDDLSVILHAPYCNITDKSILI